MTFRGKALAAALALVIPAVIAVAQSADPNTAGPTKNTFRLKVLEPLEGATVTGPSVRVSASTAIPGESSEAQIAPTDRTPRPQILVYLDNEQKAVLNAETNTVVLDNVPAGTHKLVLIAKNQSGEVIDRKEVAFATVPLVAASGTITANPPAPAPVAAPPPSEPAPAMESTTTRTTSTEMPETLPQTASLLPLAALAGAALLSAGAALKRRRS